MTSTTNLNSMFARIPIIFAYFYSANSSCLLYFRQSHVSLFLFPPFFLSSSALVRFLQVVQVLAVTTPAGYSSRSRSKLGLRRERQKTIVDGRERGLQVAVRGEIETLPAYMRTACLYGKQSTPEHVWKLLR